MRTNEKFTEVTVQLENGTQWVLEYYIQTLATHDNGEIYALRVDKVSTNGNLIEREETYGLTDSKKEALTMARAFAAGTVPPCVLMEMADEWLTDFIQKAPAHTSRRAG